MEVKVFCHSIEQELTGHNNDFLYIYTFVPEIMFGGWNGAMMGEFKYASPSKMIYAIGEHYTLVFK